MLRLPQSRVPTSGQQHESAGGRRRPLPILSAKSYNALPQFNSDGGNIYLRELGQKKLWMNQQSATGRMAE